MLLAHDIMPIVRLYRERPHPHYVVFPGQVAAYVAAGARYFEVGNEPNISPDEWQPGTWPAAADMGRIIAEQWMGAADMVRREGGIPLVYAMTPGGTYAHAGGHRRITRDFLQHLKDRGALGALEGAGIAIHPRPHNNPPDTVATAANDVTFNEYEWFAATYKEFLGWTPPLFATEHGYSMGDSQNSNFPPTDEGRWVDYNQELFERMNPSHPKALPPYLFALCYWLETAGGTWANDEVSRGWYPDGLRAWGQRIASMRVVWNRQAQAAPTPTPEPEVPVTDKLVQILQAKLGERFKDVRDKMPNGKDDKGRAVVYGYADSHKMPRIALHYSASSAGPTTPLGIARFHVDPVSKGGRGWPGIGYHFVIDEGTAYYVGHVDTQRAHVAGRNDEALGICWTGTYNTELPSAPDIEAGKLLIAGLDEFYQHKKKLEGHNQMLPGHTLCPGRIVELIPILRQAAPIPPKPLPTPNIQALIELAKNMQVISPNWGAALSKAAVREGFSTILGNELSFEQWIFQLFARPDGKEALFYVERGKWEQVEFSLL